MHNISIGGTVNVALGQILKSWLKVENTHKYMCYLSIQLGYFLLAVGELSSELSDCSLHGMGSILGRTQQGLLFLDLLVEIILSLLVALRLVFQFVCQLCNL